MPNTIGLLARDPWGGGARRRTTGAYQTLRPPTPSLMYRTRVCAGTAGICGIAELMTIGHSHPGPSPYGICIPIASTSRILPFTILNISAIGMVTGWPTK